MLRLIVFLPRQNDSNCEEYACSQINTDDGNNVF
ncbi:hypothetical protein CP082626L3_0054A, partial [Chlamydia psittaci 08-2626_L3]